jgi:glucan 1,3-beta-glucosidase
VHRVGRTALTIRESTPNVLTSRGIRGARQWFSNSTNIDRTIAALTALTAEFTQPRYGGVVQTIELVNEPFPQNTAELDTLRTFYRSAYRAVRSAQAGPIVAAIDEGFVGLNTWLNFMTEPDYQQVSLDTHYYLM